MAGIRWLQTISTELDATRFGIICVTPRNIGSRWLNFEAGALSKVFDDTTRVVPLLYGFESLSDVAPPLGQFQAKMANEVGIKDLVVAVNQLLDNPLDRRILDQILDTFWPKLELELAKIDKELVSNRTASPRYDGLERLRADRELLEEILDLIRGAAWTHNKGLYSFTGNASDLAYEVQRLGGQVSGDRKQLEIRVDEREITPAEWRELRHLIIDVELSGIPVRVLPIDDGADATGLPIPPTAMQQTGSPQTQEAG
jgi:hypothetical protein